MADSANIGSFVERLIERERITGLTLSVHCRGREIVRSSFGEKQIGSGDRADSQTIYAIASLTKQFTATLLLMLTEESLVGLEDPVARYFPEYGFSTDLKVQHLLFQTSGLIGYTELENFDILCRRDVPPDRVIRAALSEPPSFFPGTEWQYSNTNYVLLAMLVEKLADQPYHELLQQRVLAKLGLERTGCNGVDRIDENASAGSTYFAFGPAETAEPWSPVWTFGTGNVFSTAGDLARWNAALLSSRFLPPDGFARMTRSARLLDGTDTHYGWGLGVWSIDGVKEVRHTGGLPGFSSVSTMYPELGIDIVVLSNTEGLDLHAIVVRPIFALLTGRLPAEVSVAPTVVASDDDLLNGWLNRACSRELDALAPSSSFRRFLTPERRKRLREIISHTELEKATLVRRTRRVPTTSYQLLVDYESRHIAANLTLDDDGMTRFLDFRDWSGPLPATWGNG